MKPLILLVVFLVTSACISIPMANTAEKEKADGQYTIYTIAEGRHRSGQFSWRKHQLNRLVFNFQLDSTAIYQTSNPVNQGDINKLYGLSDGSIFHHQNSARFGWRWYNDQLEIWTYIYNNGNRDYEKIGVVDLNKKHKASIIFAANKYIFQLNDKTLEMPRSSAEPLAYGYKLFPYFGGDERAPHEIRISIEEV